MSNDRRDGGTGWGFDGATLASLRLERARAAIDAKDPTLALVEVEELLDEQPGQPDAMALAGRALLMMGDAHAAAATLEQVTASQPDDGGSWSRLAFARVQVADPMGALDAAERALALPRVETSDLARAHFVRGLLARRQGQAGADDDLRRAAELAPTVFPLAQRTSPTAWARALDRALRSLPSRVAELVERTPPQVQDHPDLELLQTLSPAGSLLARSLVVGRPPEPEEWDHLPDAIYLYRENLTWPPCSPLELELRIGEALVDAFIEWSGDSPEPELEDLDVED